MVRKKLVINLLLISWYWSPIMPITASTIQITMDGQALTLPTTAHSIAALDNSADPKYTPGGEITTPAFQSSIKASDLVTPLANSANMYTINRSGRYYVANDLSRTNPNQFTGCTMLYINSSDVTLDLNGKTIRASQFVNASTLTAIKIAANLSNITIRNGTINGFNSLAASPTTQYITTGIDATAGTNKNLSLCDLQVINIGGNGVTITSNQDLLIQNVTISNCLNAGDIKALFLTNCNSVKVLNCNFNNVSSSGGPAHGVYATGCNTLLFDGCTAAEIGLNNSNDNNARGFNTSTTKDVTFLNCTATRITATRTSGTPDAIGFKLESSGYGPFKLVNCTSSQGAGAIVYGFYAEATGAYSDCDADSNASTSGLCHGFSLTGAPGSKLTNCTADKNSATSGAAVGFNIASSSHATTLSNCAATSNSSATSGNATGIVISASNGCQLTSCTVSGNNSSVATATVSGINIASSGGTTVLNTVVNNNYLTSGSTGKVYGVQLSGATGTRLLNCQSRNNDNDSTNSSAGVAGFYSSSSGSANEFSKCLAVNNTLSTTAAQGTVAGIWLVGETRSQIKGCDCSANNAAGTPVTPQKSFGIYLQTSCSNTTIRDCLLNFNSGFQNWGFYDDAADTTSILINNVAAGQGRCIGVLTSSYQFPTNTSMNYYFQYTGDQENPANIIQETDNFNWTTISTGVQNWSNISIALGEVS